ncbi:hypothetical protein, partial [Polyangium sp. 15x6]|uniref:hypothetical protein n=1 Tax=Polyangium sp. 15x6 TaxID=3042687 RepID=UPI00249B87D2
MSRSTPLLLSLLTLPFAFVACSDGNELGAGGSAGSLGIGSTGPGSTGPGGAGPGPGSGGAGAGGSGGAGAGG